MRYLLGLIPALIIVIAVIIYRFNGRKELLKMDLVQFIYAFVLAPLMFLWFKTFIFLNLKRSLGLFLSEEDIFTTDTVFSLLFMYFFGFIVIHSLTKTFQIKKDKDPLYDIFTHSEYFHMWLSHIVFYSVALVLVFLTGLYNLFVPASIFVAYASLWLAVLLGILIGLLGFIGFLLFNDGGKKTFNRLIKIQIYGFASVYLISYLVIKPPFEPHYALYWFASCFFITISMISPALRRLKIAKQIYHKVF